MPPRAGALLAIVLWGVSFVATRIALQETHPVTLVFTRFGIGVVVLMAHLRARRLPLPAWHGGARRWAWLAAMGFVGVFLHQMLQAWGLTLTTAMNTGWLIGLIPVWSALLAAAFFGERFGTGKVAGLAIGLAGTLLVMSHGESLDVVLRLPATRGDLLVLASTVTWAVYTVLGRRATLGVGSARATAGAMLCGWLMMAPFFAARQGWRDYAAISPGGWGAILFLGVGCSGLGYLLWYGALERLEATRVASLLYLEPLVTCAASTIVLHEPLLPITVAGGVLVLAGVSLVQRDVPVAPPPAPGPPATGPGKGASARQEQGKAPSART